MTNMKYKVGDRVRIVEKWNKDTCHSPSMDKWLGKTMTIRNAVNRFLTMEVYQMVEDDGAFYWNDACIAGLANEDSRKIVITTDGVETLARLYDGKNVVKSATAKCSPSDKFDFNTGVKIAVDRLLGEEKPADKPKFEVGKYYKCELRRIFCRDIKGIIKITKIENGRAYYEHVEGMKGDNAGGGFAIKSGFADCLTPIDYTEKTKKPKLYNGKVVCTKSCYRHWTVGKVYEIKDGIITDDDGQTRGKLNPYKSFEDFKKRLIDSYPVVGKFDFIPLVD